VVDIVPPQTVLTPADAANQLQNRGLDALGVTAPTLSPAWSATAPGTVDEGAMQLALNAPLAPFTGVLRVLSSPTSYTDAAGAPLASPAAALELHPVARHRLLTLVTRRLGAPLIRPVPVAMLVHGITPPAEPDAVDWHRAGEPLGYGGSQTVSFHDVRGLPIDPIAVASLFADLLVWLPALAAPGVGPAGSPGNLAAVTALAGTTAVRCHVISPHGRSYSPVRERARLEVLTTAGEAVADVPADGLVALATGRRLGRSNANTEADAEAGNALQWGFSFNSTLGTNPLVVPPLPAGVALPRQFFRVTAVDLAWHLLGNRGLAPAHDAVPSDDGTTPPFALPRVRLGVTGFEYLADANDVLGAAGAAATGFPAPGAPVRALLVSPEIDNSLALPPAPGPPAHWPRFPGPAPAPSGPPLAQFAATGAATPTAAWRTGTGAQQRDVVVSVPADAVPPGTHLRLFPRLFREIRAIGEKPSFERGDGGAGIAAAATATQILLVNPFQITGSSPRPDPATLTVDVVATGRDGTRRMLSSIDLPVLGAAPFAPTFAPFGGASLSPAAIALLSVFGSTSTAPTSLFGIPPGPPGSAGTGIVGLVRALANETTAPRQGPRLPTQARFETILALGTVLPPAEELNWTAVLSGARWVWESRCAEPELGDPGNPAGPDVHAAGVRVGARLAYDLAIHAVKRAQPVLPLAADTVGWLLQTAGSNWDVPPEDPAATVSAAMLETVAPFVDSPELSFVPMLQPTHTVQSAVDALAERLGISPAPTVTIENESRLREQLQREIATAKSGQRDALWSLRRALAEANEYVYLESPMLARTSRGGGGPADVDLIEVLRQRLQENPRLKVIICLPRHPDFVVEKENWVRAALRQRREALEQLSAAAPNRVAAFHPIGFPGRPTYVRSTVVLVDDSYAVVGTSHLRRRGMTFDGGVDVASIDRALDGRGASASIARFRQRLLASRLGVAVPQTPAESSALWTRLAEPASTFDVIADLLRSGGEGRCAPIWAGPTDEAVIPQSDAISDPNGVDPTGDNLLAIFGALLLES
jgi:hypothetical protein